MKLWLDDLEEGVLQQAKNLANLPFVFKWVAIMPDAHQGVRHAHWRGAGDAGRHYHECRRG